MRSKIQSSQVETSQPINRKLQQFLDELNELCTKYQYRLNVCLSYTPNGIVPRLNIADAIPSKKEVKPKRRKNG